MGLYLLVKFFMALDKMMLENNIYSRADAFIYKPSMASISEKEYFEIATRKSKK